MKRRAGVSAVVALVCLASPLRAQAAGDRPWFIVLSVGPSWGGPGADMEAHLKRTGGYDASGCGFFGCVEYPSVHRPGARWSAAVGRVIVGRLFASFAVDGGDLGWVLAEGDSGTVARRWSSTAVSVTVTYQFLPEFWLGVGPALAWLRSAAGAPGARGVPGSRRLMSRSLGAHVEAGLQTSASKPLFFTCTASYIMLPQREEGPYEQTIGGALEPFDAGYSHLVVAAGVGARWRLP